MTLVDFLLARIAEDEEWAQYAAQFGSEKWSPDDLGRWMLGGDWQPMTQAEAEHIARHDPARVLAECEAKRFVIDALRGYEPSDEWGTESDMGKRANNAAGALRRLALPYADHSSYDESWRP